SFHRSLACDGSARTQAQCPPRSHCQIRNLVAPRGAAIHGKAALPLSRRSGRVGSKSPRSRLVGVGKLVITPVGMVCAVGLNAQAACAAVRAGITGFRELPYSDNGSEAIVGAIVPGLPTSMRRDERLVAMLVMALVDCGRSLAPDVSVDVPLIVGLAESG